jgi:hypothetical protein
MEEHIKKWAEQFAYDKISIKNVGHSNFRVNLYIMKGDVIRFYSVSRSFYLEVSDDGTIKDKTLCKK